MGRDIQTAAAKRTWPTSTQKVNDAVSVGRHDDGWVRIKNMKE